MASRASWRWRRIWRWTKAAQAATAAGALRAKLGGGFTFDLAQDLKPATVKGDVTFSVEQATARWRIWQRWPRD